MMIAATITFALGELFLHSAVAFRWLRLTSRLMREPLLRVPQAKARGLFRLWARAWKNHRRPRLLSPHLRVKRRSLNRLHLKTLRLLRHQHRIRERPEKLHAAVSPCGEEGGRRLRQPSANRKRPRRQVRIPSRPLRKKKP